MEGTLLQLSAFHAGLGGGSRAPALSWTRFPAQVAAISPWVPAPGGAKFEVALRSASNVESQ